MAASVNEMLASLRGLVTQMVELSERLTVAAKGLQTASSDQEHVTSQQSAYAQEIAATFEELKRIIRSGPGEWNRKRERIPQFYEYNSGDELIERIHFADVRA